MLTESRYTMKLYEALEIDPTIFNFSTPDIIIDCKNLKDWISEYYFNREIGYETIGTFKYYLEREFKVQSAYLVRLLSEYSKLESKDFYANANTNTEQVNRVYLIPANTGYTEETTESERASQEPHRSPSTLPRSWACYKNYRRGFN